MGKLWGYDYDTYVNKHRYTRIYGMLASQNIGKKKRHRKTLMKLPSVNDMQRMVLAKHLARLNQFPVFRGKKEDNDFEEAVDDFIDKTDLKFKAASCRKVRHCCLKGCKDVFRVLRTSKIVDAKLGGKPMRRRKKSDTISGDIDNPEGPTIDKPAVKMEFNFNYDILTDYALHVARLKERSGVTQALWESRYLRDRTSDRLNEVYSMNRMVTQTCKSSRFYQHPYTMSVEGGHYALKTHNWKAVAKAVCIMLRITGRQQHKFIKASSITMNVICTWQLGFLALVNTFKDNLEIIKQYAIHFKDLFKANPLWVGIHVATWFIQKGYVSEAFEMLEQCDDAKFWALRNTYLRRQTIRHIRDIFLAVRIYGEWKRECRLLIQEVTSEGDVELNEILHEGIRRKGETALSTFEMLHDQQKDVKGDVMIYLKPLIELLVEYRSSTRAMEVLKRMLNDDVNKGNLVLEEFYVKFLEANVHTLDIEPEEVSLLKQKFQQKVEIKKGPPLECLKQRRRIRAMREAKKKDGFVPTFKKIELPGFSW